tara:strand:+ start:11422 stop:12903 length:1482 start_codon:yes stop_codon:yes gene_type:complete
MVKQLPLLTLVLTITSAIVYKPFLSLWVYQNSLLLAEQLVDQHIQKTTQRIQNINHILPQISKSMKQCDPKQLWLLEYQNIETKLIGYQDLRTKDFCWSQSILNDLPSAAPKILKTVALTDKSGIELLEIDNYKAMFFYKILAERRWSIALEDVNISSPICSQCYRIEWSEEQAVNTEYFRDGRYQIQAKILNLPILFHLNLSSIQDAYLAQIQPWILSSLILFNILILTVFTLNSISKRKLRSQLNKAIRKKQMKPYFQPIIESKTGKVIAVEVLARWQVKEQIIPPSEFIEFAERSGLIDDLVISLVQQTHESRKRFTNLLKEVSFSFNVTPRQLERSRFTQKFFKLCLRVHSENTPIALELTEREAFKDLEHAKEVLTRFTQAGLSIKLDDTGTGYGSFSYIQLLGFQIIKIDKMFVDTIETDDVKRSVLDAIIEFGHTANLTMIAEGVETESQARYLIDHGVTIHQGYLYSKPLNFNELVSFIQQNKKF